MNRKGVKMISKATLGVVFAIVSLLFIIYISVTIFGSFSENKCEKSIGTFNLVNQRINGFISGNFNEGDVKEVIPLNRESGCSIVGFNKDTESQQTIDKPSECRNLACLCLCSGVGERSCVLNDNCELYGDIKSFNGGFGTFIDLGNLRPSPVIGPSGQQLNNDRIFISKVDDNLHVVPGNEEFKETFMESIN